MDDKLSSRKIELISAKESPSRTAAGASTVEGEEENESGMLREGDDDEVVVVPRLLDDGDGTGDANASYK